MRNLFRKFQLNYFQLLCLCSIVASPWLLYKSGPKHLLTSYRPIKLASALCRLAAKVVQSEVMYRAELDNSFSGQLFSYRKEILTQSLPFICRAVTTLSLLESGESHVIDGDESSAFDTLIRSLGHNFMVLFI